MVSTTENHITIWTTSFFPIAFFDKILQSPFEKHGIKYIAIEIKEDYGQRLRPKSILSLQLSNSFYKDFLALNKEGVLYESLNDGLRLFWEGTSTQAPEIKSIWEELYKSKFSINYVASDGVVLNFDYPINLDPGEEVTLWSAMYNLIRSYELKDEPIITLVKITHAQKDQLRYFSYNISTGYFAQTAPSRSRYTAPSF